MNHQNNINLPLNFELPIKGGSMKFEARSSQSNSKAELFIKFQNNQHQKNQLKNSSITTKKDKNLSNRRQTVNQYNDNNSLNKSYEYSQKQRRSRLDRNNSEKRLNQSLRQSILYEKKESIKTPSRLMRLLFNEVSEDSPFHDMNIQENYSDDDSEKNKNLISQSPKFSQNKMEIPKINLDNLQNKVFSQKHEINQDEIESQNVTGHFSYRSFYPSKNQLNKTLSHEKLLTFNQSPKIQLKQKNSEIHASLKQKNDVQSSQENQFLNQKIQRAGQSTALMQRYLALYGEPSERENSSFQEINRCDNLVRNSSNPFLKNQSSYDDLSKTFTAWPSKFQPKEDIIAKQKQFKNLNYSQTILNNYLRNDSFERTSNIKSDENDQVNFKSNETQLSIKKLKPQILNPQNASPNRNTDENLLSKLNPNLIKTFEKESLSELKHRFRFNPQQKDDFVAKNYQSNQSYKQSKLVNKFVDFSLKIMNRKNTFFVKEVVQTLRELNSKIKEKKQFILKSLVLFYCVKIQKNYRAYMSRKYYIRFYMKLKLIRGKSCKGNFGAQYLYALALGWKVRQLFKLKEVKSKISLIKEHQNINYRDIIDLQRLQRNLQIYTRKFISYLQQITQNNLWIMQKRNNQSQFQIKNKQNKTFKFNSARKPQNQNGYVLIESNNKFKPNFASKEYQIIAHSNYQKRVNYKPGLTVKSNRSDSGQRKVKPVQQINQDKREFITLLHQTSSQKNLKPSIRSNRSDSSPVQKAVYQNKTSEKDQTSASTYKNAGKSYKQSGSKFQNPYILSKKLTRNLPEFLSNKSSQSNIYSVNNNNKSCVSEFEIKSSATSKVDINNKYQKGDNLFVNQNQDIYLNKSEKNVVFVSNIPKNLNNFEQNQLLENFKTLANGIQFASELQDDGVSIHLIFEDSEHAILTAIKIDGIFIKNSQLKAKVLQLSQQSVNLFELSNLPEKIQSDQLFNILSNYGDVAQISLNQKYNSALIIMQTQKDYEQVMAVLKKPGSLKLQGKNIEINAKAKQQCQQQQQVLEIDNLPKDMNDEEVDELFSILHQVLDGNGFSLDVLKSADGQTSQAIIFIPENNNQWTIQSKIKTHLLSFYNQQIDTRMADFQSIEIAGLIISKQNLQTKLQELGGLLLSLSEEGIAISRFPSHEMAVNAMNKIKDKQASFLGKNISANPILAPVNTSNLMQNQQQKKIHRRVSNSVINMSNIVLIKNLPKDLNDEQVDNLFQFLENLFDRSQIELEIMNSSESQTADAIIKFQNYQLANAAVKKINQNNYIMGNFVKATQIQFDSLILYNLPQSFTKQELISSLNKIIPNPPLDNKFIIDELKENQEKLIIIKFINQEKALKALGIVNSLLTIKGRKIISFPNIKEDQHQFDDHDLFQTPFNNTQKVNQNKLSVIPERSQEQTEQNYYPTGPANSPLIDSKAGGNSFIIHEEWDLENILDGPIHQNDLNLDLDLPTFEKINESYRKIEIKPFQETTFGSPVQEIKINLSKPETNFGSPIPEIKLKQLSESFSDPKPFSDLFISDFKTPSDQFRRSPIIQSDNKPFKFNLLKMDGNDSLKSLRDSDDSKIEFQIELRDQKQIYQNQDVCISIFEENQQTFRELKPRPLDKYFIKKENNLEIAIQKRLDSSNNKPKPLDENEIKQVIQKVLQKNKDLTKKLVKLDQKIPKVSQFSRQSQPKQKRKVDSLYSNPTASSLQREKFTLARKNKFDN